MTLLAWILGCAPIEVDYAYPNCGDEVQTLFLDADGDGWGAGTPFEGCPGQGVSEDGDCDDTDAERHPQTTWRLDEDGDGFGGPVLVQACETPEQAVDGPETDCDDSDPEVHPEAPELCNDIDDNCDGNVDWDPDEAPLWYRDLDQDGYGDMDDGGPKTCAAATGRIDNNLDCDDSDPDIHPEGFEICDQRDNDCDGEVDEDAADPVEVWPDADQDGFGDAEAESLLECPGGDYAANDLDCDDGDDGISPLEDEDCGDGVDNDCDGDTDAQDSDCA